jgi:hypothetical protein
MLPPVQVTAAPARTAKLAPAVAEGADDAASLLRAFWFEVRDGADVGPHARETATSGTRRANRALSRTIYVLQVRG